MRDNEPIGERLIRGIKRVNITSSPEFIGWEAAIAAGATLDELIRWDKGEYKPRFMARVIKWHELSGLVSLHKQSASMPKGK